MTLSNIIKVRALPHIPPMITPTPFFPPFLLLLSFPSISFLPLSSPCPPSLLPRFFLSPLPLHRFQAGLSPVSISFCLTNSI